MPAAPPAAKRRGRPTGSRNKPKIVAVPVEPEPFPQTEAVAEVALPPPKRVRKQVAVAPQHNTYVKPAAPEPPWAQHESAAAYLKAQLRALKNHRQLAKHEMWGQLIREHW